METLAARTRSTKWKLVTVTCLHTDLSPRHNFAGTHRHSLSLNEHNLCILCIDIHIVDDEWLSWSQGLYICPVTLVFRKIDCKRAQLADFAYVLHKLLQSCFWVADWVHYIVRVDLFPRVMCTLDPTSNGTLLHLYPSASMSSANDAYLSLHCVIMIWGGSDPPLMLCPSRSETRSR